MTSGLDKMYWSEFIQVMITNVLPLIVRLLSTASTNFDWYFKEKHSEANTDCSILRYEQKI